MITTHVKTESKPVEQLNDAADGQIELNPVGPPISARSSVCARIYGITLF